MFRGSVGITILVCLGLTISSLGLYNVIFLCSVAFSDDFQDYMMNNTELMDDVHYIPGLLKASSIFSILMLIASFIMGIVQASRP